MRRSAQGRAEVGIDSFDRGLVTLVPSDQAGRISGVVPGANPNPQTATVQYGPDLRNAVVTASNVRFENGSAESAPGYEQASIGDFDEEPVLIYQSQQVGQSVPGSGKFFFVCTSAGIYLVVPG